jgi:hypothetical protein
LSTIILGNSQPTETWRDAEDKVQRRRLSVKKSQTIFVVRHGDPFAGRAEILHAWHNHHSEAPPAWVLPVNGLYADLLADGIANHFQVDETQREAVKELRRLARDQGGEQPPLPDLHTVAREIPGDWYDDDSAGINGPTALKTNLGNDQQSKQMGGDLYPVVGTSSAITATTLTTNQNYGGTANVLAGILSHTSGANSVLTVDKWYDPANPGGAALATPSTGAYVILPGGAPISWMGITTDATAPAATDTSLASELALSGLTRALCTYAHTTAAASYTESKQFTNPDTTARTINKAGMFYSANGSTLSFESAVPSPPVLASATDSTTITETISL